MLKCDNAIMCYRIFFAKNIYNQLVISLKTFTHSKITHSKITHSLINCSITSLSHCRITSGDFLKRYWI